MSTLTKFICVASDPDRAVVKDPVKIFVHGLCSVDIEIHQR